MIILHLYRTANVIIGRIRRRGTLTPGLAISVHHRNNICTLVSNSIDCSGLQPGGHDPIFVKFESNIALIIFYTTYVGKLHVISIIFLKMNYYLENILFIQLIEHVVCYSVLYTHLAVLASLVLVQLTKSRQSYGIQEGLKTTAIDTTVSWIHRKSERACSTVGRSDGDFGFNFSRIQCTLCF